MNIYVYVVTDTYVSGFSWEPIHRLDTFTVLTNVNNHLSHSHTPGSWLYCSINTRLETANEWQFQTGWLHRNSCVLRTAQLKLIPCLFHKLKYRACSCGGHLLQCIWASCGWASPVLQNSPLHILISSDSCFMTDGFCPLQQARWLLHSVYLKETWLHLSWLESNCQAAPYLSASNAAI